MGIFKMPPAPLGEAKKQMVVHDGTLLLFPGSRRSHVPGIPLHQK